MTETERSHFCAMSLSLDVDKTVATQSTYTLCLDFCFSKNAICLFLIFLFTELSLLSSCKHKLACTRVEGDWKHNMYYCIPTWYIGGQQGGGREGKFRKLGKMYP